MEPFLGVSGCICHPEAPCGCCVMQGEGEICVFPKTRRTLWSVSRDIGWSVSLETSSCFKGKTLQNAAGRNSIFIEPFGKGDRCKVTALGKGVCRKVSLPQRFSILLKGIYSVFSDT